LLPSQSDRASDAAGSRSTVPVMASGRCRDRRASVCCVRLIYCKVCRQIRRGTAHFVPGNLFGRAGCNHFTSLISGTWSDVDDPVARGNDIHVVLYHEYRVASLNESFGFASHQDYLNGIGHRTAALEDSRLLPLSAIEMNVE
jgi:hypothetical protein